MLFNFTPRFADLVATGQKLNTIRPIRKDGKRAQPGSTAHLWTGTRTKQARLLGRTKVVGTMLVEIQAGILTLSDRQAEPHAVLCCLDKRYAAEVSYAATRTVQLSDLDAFAKADGFSNWRDLTGWFEAMYGPLPHTMVLTRWEKPTLEVR